jgi:hypothetical protein
MNPLFKILIDKTLSEHTLEELSNENLHYDIEKEYNKIVEDYKKSKMVNK